MQFFTQIIADGLRIASSPNTHIAEVVYDLWASIVQRTALCANPLVTSNLFTFLDSLCGKRAHVCDHTAVLTPIFSCKPYHISTTLGEQHQKSISDLFFAGSGFLIFTRYDAILSEESPLHSCLLSPKYSMVIAEQEQSVLPIIYMGYSWLKMGDQAEVLPDVYLVQLSTIVACITSGVSDMVRISVH